MEQKTTSSRTIVWVHGDNLNPNGPALRAHPGAPALWVWDEPLLRAWGISLKRILFIYESLLELPVVIRRGQMVAQIARFAAEHNADTIATAASPSPRFAEICRRLREAGFAVTVHEERPFVEPDRAYDLKRFSRYWRAAQQSALQRSDRQ